MRSEGLMMPWLSSLSSLLNKKSVSIANYDIVEASTMLIEELNTDSKTLLKASTRVNKLVEAIFIGLSI